MAEDYALPKFNSYHSQQSQPNVDICSLYVKNVPAGLSNDTFRALFSKFGKIERFRLYPPWPNFNVTIGLVSFATPLEAQRALRQLNHSPPYNLDISYAKKSNVSTERSRHRYGSSSSIPDTASDISSKSDNSRVSEDEDYKKYLKITLDGNNRVVSMYDSQERKISNSQLHKLIPNPNILCLFCKKPGEFSCSDCLVPYCSRTCQVEDWQHHKAVCKSKSEKKSQPQCDTGYIECSNLDSENRTNGQLSNSVTNFGVLRNKTKSFHSSSTAQEQSISLQNAASKEVPKNPNHRIRPECKKHKKSRQPQYGRAVPRLGNHIQPDPQAIRPNSLELHSSYFNRQQVPYTEGTKPQYLPPPPAYTEHPISPQQHYPPPPYAAATPDRQVNSPSGTPTRNIYRINLLRRSQRPPAPVNPRQPQSTPTPVSSGSSSGLSTPTVSAGMPSSGGSQYQNFAKYFISQKIKSEISPKEKESQNSPVIGPGAKTSPEKRSLSLKSVASNSSRGSKMPPDKSAEEKRVDESDLPPSPPLPQSNVTNGTEEKKQSQPPHPPPPPPPPLAPLEDLVIDVAENGSISESQNMEVVSVTSESASETSSVSKFSEQFDGKKCGHNDGRSELLAAIREGIKLKRVEDIKQKEVEKAAPLHGVASILARRAAMEFSDSDSPSQSEYDSDGWNEEAEHAKT